MKHIKNSIGFDIGTTTLRLYKDGKQVVETPTELQDNAKTIRNLLVKGKIARLSETEEMLKKESNKIRKSFLGLWNPPMYALVSIPSDLNEVTLRAYRDTLEQAGAKICYMITDSLVAATGLGLDMSNSTSTIVDFGAGKTSITTLRGLEIIKNDFLELAGNTFDEDIQLYLSSHYDLKIDLKTAEALKIEYADLRKADSAISKTIGIKGKDKRTNSPKEIALQSEEITDCIRLDVDLITEKIVRHVENLENADLDKVKSNGIYLVGKSIRLRGLTDIMSERIKIANKSYALTTDYMKIGFEKIQTDPGQVYLHLIV